jgi:hypothetical protein
MRRRPASKKANCAASYFLIFAAGSACPLNGAALAAGQFPTIGIPQARAIRPTIGRQSQRRAFRQRYLELRLFRARKRNSDQSDFRGLRPDNRKYAPRQRPIVEIRIRFNGRRTAKFSIPRTLSFVTMALCGSIRSLRGGSRRSLLAESRRAVVQAGDARPWRTG